MTYPTVVADPKSKNPAGYPVSMYPYCIQVDAKGNVAKHGFLNDIFATTKQVAKVAAGDTQPKISGEVQATQPETG